MPAASGGGGYTGPGDVVSGASAWWGMRGYNAAYATGSNPCCDLVDGSGLNPITINILSTGKIDVASINAWVTAHSVASIHIVKMYDQTGNGHDMTATVGNAATMTVSGLNSMPTADFTGGHNWHATGFAVSQPYSVAGAAMFTAHAGVQALMTDSTQAQFLFATTPALRLKSNTALDNSTTLSNNTWYRIQAVGNGASSVVTVNGSDTTGNAGSNGISNGHTLTIGSDDFSENFTGSLVEEGVWPSGFSGTNRSNMDSNISAFWAI